MKNHPFLSNSSHPAWSALNPECVRHDITMALEESEKNLQSIRNLNVEEVTFLNSVKALEQSTTALDEAWGLVAHLDSVCNSDELRNAYNDILPAVTEFAAKIPLDAKLWQAIKNFVECEEAKKP
jgi:oligopeptidase A